LTGAGPACLIRALARFLIKGAAGGVVMSMSRELTDRRIQWQGCGPAASARS
jgi:hypothetical protein